MTSKKKKGAPKEISIKRLSDLNNPAKISLGEIKKANEGNFLLFSFRYYKDKSIRKCNDCAFFLSVLEQFNELSTRTWTELIQSGRHKFGYEKLAKEKIKTDWNGFKEIMTPEIKTVDVFRADKEKHSIVGLLEGRIYHIFFIEAQFGDIYNHNKK